MKSLTELKFIFSENLNLNVIDIMKAPFHEVKAIFKLYMDKLKTEADKNKAATDKIKSGSKG